MIEWLIALTLLVTGIYLSAFFSGAETGFYRVSRVRLVLDSRSGDRIAERLLWLVSRPALFVATTLVGNNVANYLTMIATVYMAQSLFGALWSGELIATLLLTPLVFVYGELIPKNLHYRAPGRLLRRRTRVFWFFLVLFLPASLPLAGLTLLLSRLVRQPPEPVQTLLGRRRLEQLFREGHEEGVLTRVQRQLVQGLFAVADRPVNEWVVPINRAVAVRANTAVREVLRLARRQRLAQVPVRADGAAGEWIGYVRTSDVAVIGSRLDDLLHPFISIPASQTCLQALLELYHQGEDLALVTSAESKPLGLISRRRLSEALFRSPA